MKGTSACVTLFGERNNLRLCLASHARILCLVSDAELSPKTGYLSPFSLRLMESQPERETCIFSALRTAM